MSARPMLMPNTSRLGGAFADLSTLEITCRQRASDVESVLNRSFRFCLTVSKDVLDAVLQLRTALGKMP